MRILKDLSLFTAQTATLNYIRKNSSMYDSFEPFPAAVSVKSETACARYALSCRYFCCNRIRDYFFQRRRNQDYLSVEMICEGHFWYRSGQTGFLAEAGDCVLLHPHRDNDLLHLRGDVCRKYGLILQGQVLEVLLREFHLERTVVVHLRDPEGTCAILNRIGNEMKQSGESSYIELSGELFKLLQLLSEEERLLPSLSRTEAIREWMAGHLGERIRLKEISEHFDLPLSRLNRFFLEECGKTPYRLLEEMRLEKAAELLRLSDLTLKEISERVGYCNSLYFSNMFARQYGRSPKFYRAMFREKPGGEGDGENGGISRDTAVRRRPRG